MSLASERSYELFILLRKLLLYNPSTKRTVTVGLVNNNLQEESSEETEDSHDASGGLGSRAGVWDWAGLGWWCASASWGGGVVANWVCEVSLASI